MAFIASCIEAVAERMGVPYVQILDRMDNVGLLDNFIFPNYEALHTESRENLTDSLISTLLLWEERKNISDNG